MQLGVIINPNASPTSHFPLLSLLSESYFLMYLHHSDPFHLHLSSPCKHLLLYLPALTFPLCQSILHSANMVFLKHKCDHFKRFKSLSSVKLKFFSMASKTMLGLPYLLFFFSNINQLPHWSRLLSLLQNLSTCCAAWSVPHSPFI